MKIKGIKVLSAFIVLLSLLLGVGCNNADTMIKTEIEVSSATACYSEKTGEYASLVIYSLLTESFEVANKRAPGREEADELLEMSEDIISIASEGGISEQAYLGVLGIIEECEEKIAAEAYKISLGKSEDIDLEFIKDTYFRLSAEAGNKYVGNLIYKLILYSAERRYARQMELYERDGHSYLLAEAHRINREREILAEEIGAQSFSSLCAIGLCFVDLVILESEDDGIEPVFSDDEIRVFVDLIDIGDISISNSGWELVLSKTAESGLFKSAAPVLDGMLALAKDNGDLTDLAARMQSLMALVGEIKSSLTAYDIALLRDGEPDEAIYAIFSGFSDDEWALFFEITDIDLSCSEYCSFYEEYYGEDFVICKGTLAPVSCDTLRASQGAEEFYNNLKGYLGGICPALAFGV